MNASLWVGVGGSLDATDHSTVHNGTVGFGISGVNLTLGSVKTATNSYTGLELTFATASILGIPDTQLDVTAGFVRINKVQTGTTKLDWAAFTGGALFGLNLNATTDLSVGGTLAVRLGGFVWASGSFAITKETLQVTPVGSMSSVSVTALEIGIDNGMLFAGVGYGTDAALGVSFSGLSVGLLNATAADGTTYFALRARGTASLVGITGFDIGGTLEVQMNTGTLLGADVPAIDFSLQPSAMLNIPTGGTAVALNLNQTLPLRVTGTAHLTISSFVYISAGFAIQKGTAQNVTLDNGDIRNVNVLTIGISNGFAFVGANGPYWVTDPNGTVRAPTAAEAGGALGIAISSVNLGIALLKPTDATFAGESYYALTGGGSVMLVGLDALSVAVRNLKIEVNGSSGNGTGTATRVVNFINAGSFGAGGLVVPTGMSSSVAIKSTSALLHATGDVTLNISDFVYVSGSFAFEKGDPMTNVALTGGAPNVDLSVLKIGAHDVHAFVGLGGPYFNDDGSVQAGSSAIGLALSGVDFGLALMKPVVASGPASPLSYYALKATVGSVMFVNTFGVTLSASNLVIEVNGSNDTGHFVNLLTRTITVPTSDTTSIVLGGGLNWGGMLLHAEGDVLIGAFGLTLSAHISFESTTRTNNTHVIKISITNLSFNVGNPVIFHLGGINGNIFVSDEGFAAEFSAPISFSVGDATNGLSFDATVSFAISTITSDIDETFNVSGGTEHLILPAGPYFRFSAIGVDVTLHALSQTFALHGDFQLEQITLPDGITKLIRIGAANVSFGTGPGGGPTISGQSGVSLMGGSGAMILYRDGVAAVFQGTFNVILPGASATTQVVLMVNTRGPPASSDDKSFDVDQTVNVNGTPIHVLVAARTFRLDLANVSINFGDILTLSGDFTIQSGTGALAGATLYGAQNVELFLGDGPYRNADGTINPNAVGVLVTGGRVGVVDFGGGQFAIYAEGTASLVGLGSFVTLSAPVVVRVNKTGRVINTTIPVTGTTCPGATCITVAFTSANMVEKFSVGNSTTAAMIDLGHVVQISGVIDFTVSPAGRIDVDIPNATIGISIPIDGVVQQVFSISGATRFSFGGGLGFSLQDIRVNGFDIFGVHATIANPATVLRAPTADLASPYAGQQISAVVFDTASSGHIDVIFTSLTPNRPSTPTTIIDDQPEFILDGPGANLVVNGHATQLDSQTFRYSFTGDLVTGLANNTIGVSFIAGSFSDLAGAANAVSTQSFSVFFGAAGTTPPPTAILLGPSSGAVVNATTLAAKGYIDVKFVASAAIDAASINGDELRLTTTAGANTLANLFSTTQFDVTQLDANTWRYTLKPGTGIAVTQMFNAGVVNVEFVANTWTAGGGTFTTPLRGRASRSRPTRRAPRTSTDAISSARSSLQGATIGLADTSLQQGQART